MQDLGRYAKRNHVQIQTRYVSVLVVSSIALVGLVFALGVLVGSRQTTQTTCPKPDPLAMLDIKANEPIPPANPKPVGLSFHASLARKSDPVPTPASLKRVLESTEEKQGEQKPEEAPARDDTSLAVPRMDELPLLEKIDSDEPVVYSLQVGSFQDRVEATQMIRKLERAGHEAFLVQVNMPDRGGLWYRVRVGPFHSKQKAWKYKKHFEHRERLPAFVVKRRAKG